MIYFRRSDRGVRGWNISSRWTALPSAVPLMLLPPQPFFPSYFQHNKTHSVFKTVCWAEKLPSLVAPTRKVELLPSPPAALFGAFSFPGARWRVVGAVGGGAAGGCIFMRRMCISGRKQHCERWPCEIKGGLASQMMKENGIILGSLMWIWRSGNYNNRHVGWLWHLVLLLCYGEDRPAEERD